GCRKPVRCLDRGLPGRDLVLARPSICPQLGGAVPNPPPPKAATPRNALIPDCVCRHLARRTGRRGRQDRSGGSRGFGDPSLHHAARQTRRSPPRTGSATHRVFGSDRGVLYIEVSRCDPTAPFLVAIARSGRNSL